MNHFTSPRLTFELPSIEDAPNIAKFLNRKDMALKLSHVPTPYKITDAHILIKNINTQRSGKFAFAIYSKRDQSFMGIVAIIESNGIYMLSYWLGYPYWGNGYMTEAANTLINAFFNRYQVNEIDVTHLLANHLSKSIIKKLGFKYIENRMIHIPSRNKTEEAMAYKLTRNRWQNKSEG